MYLHGAVHKTTRKRGNCAALQLEASRSVPSPRRPLAENCQARKLHLILSKCASNFNSLYLIVSEIRGGPPFTLGALHPQHDPRGENFHARKEYLALSICVQNLSFLALTVADIWGGPTRHVRLLNSRFVIVHKKHVAITWTVSNGALQQIWRLTHYACSLSRNLNCDGYCVIDCKKRRWIYVTLRIFILKY